MKNGKYEASSRIIFFPNVKILPTLKILISGKSISCHPSNENDKCQKDSKDFIQFVHLRTLVYKLI